MRACFGILGHRHNDPLVAQTRELTAATVLPIFNGTLLIFSEERYALCFDQLLNHIRVNHDYRYILTVGTFNSDERPLFYDLYSRFSSSLTQTRGEVLLCAQTYAKAITEFRLVPSAQYHPLVTGMLVGTLFVDTGFGRLENSSVWYTTGNVSYIDHHNRFDGMTRRSELEFWYSPAGFLYLAHQAAIIRAYKTKSRRIVVYSRVDLNSPQFLKLLFAFEAIGVELALVYEDDFLGFTQTQQLGSIEIFSRAGANSLVAMEGQAYYSDSSDVALTISDAQTQLISGRGVYRSAKDFMAAFEQVIAESDRQSWERRAATARQMLEKFSSYPLAQQQVVLETYVERWRTL